MTENFIRKITGFVEKYYLTKPIILYKMQLNTLNIKTFEFKTNFRINLNGKRVGQDDKQDYWYRFLCTGANCYE